MTMRIAVCSVAMNESEYIGVCIDNWKDLVEKHLVLVSLKPWNGPRLGDDGTFGIAKRHGAEVIAGEWKSEAEQRSWGLARLYDYDYVLQVDPDELYTKQDQISIINRLNQNNGIDVGFDPSRKIAGFRCPKMITYWKTSDYILDPADNHKPVIAVDPKQLYCHEHRQFKYMSHEDDYLSYAPIVEGITCHHMSWAKPDDKVKAKIEAYSHAEWINNNWFYDVWMKWQPGSDMLCRPYGEEKSRSLLSPAPSEIVQLIENSRRA